MDYTKDVKKDIESIKEDMEKIEDILANSTNLDESLAKKTKEIKQKIKKR